MVFSHFRKHEKSYLYFGLGAMFFALVVFSVPSALSGIARGGAAKAGPAGAFVDSTGKRIEISAKEYRDTFQFVRYRFLPGVYRTPEEMQVFEHLVMVHEADLAGVHAEDDAVAKTLQAMFGRGSKADYLDWLANTGLQPSAFEEYVRDVIRLLRLRSLKGLGDLITSVEVFERFQEDAEVNSVEYVGFAFADHDVDAALGDDTTLLAHLENEVDEGTKRRDYSTPEQYAIDAAFIDYDTVSMELLAEALEGLDEPTDEEIEQQFNFNIPRYEARAPKDEPAKDEPAKDEDAEPEGSGEEPTKDGSEDEPEAEEEKPLALDDVRDLVVKDVRLNKLLEKLESDYNAFKAELEKPSDATPNDGDTDDADTDDADTDDADTDDADTDDADTDDADTDDADTDDADTDDADTDDADTDDADTDDADTDDATQTMRTQTMRTQTMRTQTMRTQTMRTQTMRTQTTRTQTTQPQTMGTQTRSRSPVPSPITDRSSRRSSWNWRSPSVFRR